MVLSVPPCGVRFPAARAAGVAFHRPAWISHLKLSFRKWCRSSWSGSGPLELAVGLTGIRAYPMGSGALCTCGSATSSFSRERRDVRL
jgi:hypothetical protein